MVVIEGLKDGPVKGEMCRLTLYGDGDVIEHFEDKFVLVGKWKGIPLGEYTMSIRQRGPVNDGSE